MSNQPQNPLPMKISFNNEIHKVLNIPSNFQQLLELISSKFAQDLPEKWIAEYIDSDGDHISLTSEEDFQILLTTTPQEALKSLKIFVKPMDNLKESIQSQFINKSVVEEGVMKEEEEKIEVDSQDVSQIKSEGVDKKEALQNKIKELNAKLENSKLNDERKNKIMTQLQQVEEKLKNLIQREEEKRQRLEKKAQMQASKSVKSKEKGVAPVNVQVQVQVNSNQQEEAKIDVGKSQKQEGKSADAEKSKDDISAKPQEVEEEKLGESAVEEKDQKKKYEEKIKELNEKLGSNLPDERKNKIMTQLQQVEEKLRAFIQREEEKKQRIEQRAQMQASKSIKSKEKAQINYAPVAMNESEIKEPAKPQEVVEEEKLGESVVEEKDQKRKYEEKIKELNEKLASNLPDERRNKIMVQLQQVEEKLKAFIQRDEDKKQRLEKRKVELEAKKAIVDKKKKEVQEKNSEKINDAKEEEEKISEKAQKALDDIEIQVQMGNDEDKEVSSGTSSYDMIE